MRKLFSIFALILTIAGFGAFQSYADEGQDGSCTHENRKSRHNFLPAVRLKFEPVFLCDDSAISILGEVGPKSYRINGTWGFFSDENQRFKIGGEYLGQKLEYKFLSSHVRRWVHQFAIGSKYQWWFECSDFLRGVQVAGNYSHARPHSLSTVFCPVEGVSNFRRIAGSCFWDVEADVILTPWDCGTLLVGISYDHLHYKRHYQNTKRLSGVGGSLDFTQRLWRNLFVEFKAQFKRPYNYAEALLTWTQTFRCGELGIGIFGNKVWGKERLPSSTSAGVELRFAFGIDNCCIVSAGSCQDRDTLCCYNTDELARWIADPAVYMPGVLAIADETLCSALVQTPLTFPPSLPGGYVFDVSSFFQDPNGNPVTFTATGLPTGFTISSDGVIRGFNAVTATENFTVTITATSVCETVTASAILTLVSLS